MSATALAATAVAGIGELFLGQHLPRITGTSSSIKAGKVVTAGQAVSAVVGFNDQIFFLTCFKTQSTIFTSPADRVPPHTPEALV